MPGLGSAIDQGMYVVGKEDRVFGKSKIAMAKISMNKRYSRLTHSKAFAARMPFL
jgi:hypothetical protein